MIGVVQAGSQAMADRYAYLPFVGLFIAASWAIADWAKPWRPAAIVAPACGILVLIALSLATRSQVDYWWDDLTLWRHTAAITQKNWMAENMIGEDLLRDNDGEAAMPHFRAAEAFEPLFPFPPLHIGIYEEEHGRPREAIVELNRVLQITQPYEAYTPDLRSSAMVYLAFAYNQLGDYQAQDKYLEMAGRLHQR
jgi:tetratricopeptide (TPR) repeat protein